MGVPFRSRLGRDGFEENRGSQTLQALGPWPGEPAAQIVDRLALAPARPWPSMGVLFSRLPLQLTRVRVHAEHTCQRLPLELDL